MASLLGKPLKIISTASATSGVQFRLGYDVTNRADFKVSSAGDLTIAPSGSDTNITGNLAVSGGLTLGTNLPYSELNLGGNIVNADISASAEIAVSKLADGSARQLLQTDAAGTGVEWTSNIDVPGTLDVTGATALDSTLTVAGDANFDSGTLFVDVSTDRVGVNTTSPVTPLDVVGGIDYKTMTLSRSVTPSTTQRVGLTYPNYAQTANVGLIGGFDNGSLSAVSVGVTPSGEDAPTLLQFWTAASYGAGGSERMRIDSSGNVGIGTTLPGSFDPSGDNLVVGTTSGSNGITIAAGPTNGSSLYFADGTSGAQRYAGLISYDHNQDRMSFFSAATERMRIDSSGNVGIGTTSPGYNLDVQGGTYSKTRVGSTQTISGQLPATGSSPGVYTWVFTFEFDGTYGAALITLDIAAGLADTGFGRYTFGVQCVAGSGNQTSSAFSPVVVAEDNLSSFTVASSGTTDRRFTVSVTRGGSEPWAGFSSFCAQIVQNVRQCRLISITAT